MHRLPAPDFDSVVVRIDRTMAPRPMLGAPRAGAVPDERMTAQGQLLPIRAMPGNVRFSR